MNKERIRMSIGLPLGIVVLAIGIAAVVIWTGPTTQPEEKVVPVKIVRTIKVSPRTEHVSVTAYGPVVPAQQVTVKPQVSGRVISHHPALVPGGFIGRGEELIRIDPADYELDLAEQESALEQARFEWEVEKGRQVVAQREWQLLQQELPSGEVNQALVLREPHLRRTEALIRSATNEIARARLALSRTSIPAPFNAIVLQESLEEGQLVEVGAEIATLAGTDEFWVQAALPLSDLQHIRLPGRDTPGASARVFLDTGNGRGVSWTGEVIRLLSSLETTGRMARVLVRIQDPLALSGDGKRLPLLLGSYVRAEIDAGILTNVLVIPRSALREGQRIWVVDSNKQLQIRDAEILWARQDTLIIPNVIKADEQLIVSGLRTALPGMKVDPQPEALPVPGDTAGVKTNAVALGGTTVRQTAWSDASP